MSDSLRPHESQHTRPPCPSLSPGVHSDSYPLSPWHHPAISSWVIPFSSCPQSLPASESFSMSQLFAWGGQSTGASALASFLPKKSQGWSPSEWTGWISLQSKGLWRIFSTQFKSINFSAPSFLHSPTLRIVNRWFIYNNTGLKSHCGIGNNSCEICTREFQIKDKMLFVEQYLKSEVKSDFWELKSSMCAGD